MHFLREVYQPDDLGGEKIGITRIYRSTDDDVISYHDISQFSGSFLTYLQGV